MKKIILSYIGLPVLISLLFSLHTHEVRARALFPVIKNPVNDYAGIISYKYKKKIDELIREHRKRTGMQIAVLTLWTIGKMSIEEYSLGTAEQWGGGSSERDDGLLFVVAVTDRKMRIETGYGIEGYIPDGKAGEILNGIKPLFKKSQYGAGILQVIEKVIDATSALKAGEDIPVSGKLMAAVYRITSLYLFYYFAGIILSMLFLWIKKRLKFRKWLTAAVILILWAGFPVLIYKFLPGAWYWKPVLFAGGLISGTMFLTAIREVRKKKITAGIFLSLPMMALITAAVFFLMIQKPDPVGETRNETYMLLSYIFSLFFQFIVWSVIISCTSECSTYSSGGYNSSSSDYSSYSGSSGSSSSSSSWSGGGGSFGGGGASASW